MSNELIKNTDELLQTVALMRGQQREPNVKFSDELAEEVQELTKEISRVVEVDA